MLHATYRRYQSAYSGLPREVWLMALVVFVNRCGSMVLPFLTLYMTSQLGIDERAAGAMISVYGLGAVVGAGLGGKLVDIVGAIRMQTVCMLLAAPIFIAIRFCTDWWSLALAIGSLSLVVEAVRPANAAAITKLTTEKNRLKGFALQRLAGNLGFSFGPAIGGVLATIDFKWLFYVDAATLFAAGLMLLFFFRMVRLPGESKVERKASGPSRSPLRDRRFVAFLLLFLLSEIVFFQFLATYPLYLRDHFQLSKPQTGALFAVNTTLVVLFEMVLVDLLGGLSKRRWPSVRLIGYGCFLSCIGFGMLPFGTSGAYAVLAMVVVTIGEMISVPLASGFVAERSAAGSEGRYMGWYTLTISAAFVLGPALGAALYDIQPELIWYVSLGVSLLVLAGFGVLSRSILQEMDSQEIETTQATRLATDLPLVEPSLADTAS